jgi:hypothetical protein
MVAPQRDRRMRHIASSLHLGLITVVAGMAGGAAFGALCASLGLLVSEEATAATATLALGGLSAAAFCNRRLPQRDRETSMGLMRGGPRVWAMANGFQLGMAATTRIGFWIWYVLPIVCALSRSVSFGLIVGGTYGATRTIGHAAIGWQIARHENDGARERFGASVLRLGPRHRAVTRIVAGATFLALFLWVGI